MNIRKAPWIAAGFALIFGVTLSADRVRLRSGKAVDGIYVGGDSKALRLLLDSGQVAEFDLEQVIAVEFATRKPTAATPPAQASPAAAAAALPNPATPPPLNDEPTFIPSS